MKGQEMLDLPQGAQVKLVKFIDPESAAKIGARVAVGTIMTRERHIVDDTELSCFAHTALEDGFDFFYAEELELV